MLYSNLNTDEITQLKFQAGNKACELINKIFRNKLNDSYDIEEAGKVLQIDEKGKVVPASPPTGLPTAPSEDGTYTLKCTVADGEVTYSWVLDEE